MKTSYYVLTHVICNFYFSRKPFTWWNSRVNEPLIFKILDRVVVNDSLLRFMATLNYKHLAMRGSDHALLLLTCGEGIIPIAKPLNFLNFWTKREDFKNVVQHIGWLKIKMIFLFD